VADFRAELKPNISAAGIFVVMLVTPRSSAMSIIWHLLLPTSLVAPPICSVGTSILIICLGLNMKAPLFTMAPRMGRLMAGMTCAGPALIHAGYHEPRQHILIFTNCSINYIG